MPDRAGLNRVYGYGAVYEHSARTLARFRVLERRVRNCREGSLLTVAANTAASLMVGDDASMRRAGMGIDIAKAQGCGRQLDGARSTSGKVPQLSFSFIAKRSLLRA